MIQKVNYFTDIPLAKSGIHIKPENKDKFTETKKRTGKNTEELTHSKNPLTKKRAIFAQNAKKWKHENGGIAKAQEGMKTPVYFKQYGINPDKFISMFQALRDKGISNLVAFEATWQSNKERPKAYYSFGVKAADVEDWANKANRSLTKGLYKAAKDSINFNLFRKNTMQYNRNPSYTGWLKTGRDLGKQFINQYIKLNNLGEPIAQITLEPGTTYAKNGASIKKHFLGGGFKGIATDNGIMVSKNTAKSKKKLIRR